MGVLSRTPAPIDADRPAAADLLRVVAAWAVATFHIWQQSWYSGAAPETSVNNFSQKKDSTIGQVQCLCGFAPLYNILKSEYVYRDFHKNMYHIYIKYIILFSDQDRRFRKSVPKLSKSPRVFPLQEKAAPVSPEALHNLPDDGHGNL